VSEAAAEQVGTIKYSLNETSRVHDVTMTAIDDVIANNVTVHQVLGQVCRSWSSSSNSNLVGLGAENFDVNRGVEGERCGRGAGRGLGRTSTLYPDNLEYFDLELACFVVFCGAKFYTLVTPKSCKFFCNANSA